MRMLKGAHYVLFCLCHATRIECERCTAASL